MKTKAASHTNMGDVHGNDALLLHYIKSVDVMEVKMAELDAKHDVKMAELDAKHEVETAERNAKIYELAEKDVKLAKIKRENIKLRKKIEELEKEKI